MTVFGGAGNRWPVEAGMGADGGGKHFAASVGERVGDGKRRGFDGVGDGESEGEGIDGAGLLIVGEFERAARAGALGPVKLCWGAKPWMPSSNAAVKGYSSSTRRPMIGKSVGPWRIQGSCACQMYSRFDWPRSEQSSAPRGRMRAVMAPEVISHTSILTTVSFR